MVEAMRMAVIGMSTLGGRLIIVDARDEDIVGFYEKHDFTRFGNSLKLGVKGADVAQIVGVPWQ